MFSAFVVNAILAHSTFDDKSEIFTHLSLLQKILPLSYFLWNKNIFDPFNFFFGKGCLRVQFDVLKEQFVHLFGNLFVQKKILSLFFVECGPGVFGFSPWLSLQ